MATPPCMELKRLCRTAVVPGARRVPLHEPIKLADKSSSARLAPENLAPAKTHASARSTPNAARPRIPRVHIFSCLRTCTRNRPRGDTRSLSSQYIFEMRGLGNDFEWECSTITRLRSEGLRYSQRANNSSCPVSVPNGAEKDVTRA